MVYRSDPEPKCNTCLTCLGINIKTGHRISNEILNFFNGSEINIVYVEMRHILKALYQKWFFICPTWYLWTISDLKKKMMYQILNFLWWVGQRFQLGDVSWGRKLNWLNLVTTQISNFFIQSDDFGPVSLNLLKYCLSLLRRCFLVFTILFWTSLSHLFFYLVQNLFIISLKLLISTSQVAEILIEIITFEFFSKWALLRFIFVLVK